MTQKNKDNPFDCRFKFNASKHFKTFSTTVGGLLTLLT